MSYRPASPDSPRVVPVEQRGTVRSAVRAHREDAAGTVCAWCGVGAMHRPVPGGR